MFQILFSRQALKFLKKAEKEISVRIVQKIDLLKETPVIQDTKRVVAANLFRVRVGDYRVLYQVNYSKNTIIIDRIDKRSRVYD